MAKRKNKLNVVISANNWQTLGFKVKRFSINVINYQFN